MPGGFGTRGTDGKIAAAEWARTKKIPYLGKLFMCTYIVHIHLDLSSTFMGIECGIRVTVGYFPKNHSGYTTLVCNRMSG